LLLPHPALASPSTDATEAVEESPEIRVTPAPVRLKDSARITIDFDVEKPLTVNRRAPRTVLVGDRKFKASPGGAPIELRLSGADLEQKTLDIRTSYFVCEDRPDAPCLLRRIHFQIPLATQGKPVESLTLRTPIPRYP
jgi:hypothetical protein